MSLNPIHSSLKSSARSKSATAPLGGAAGGRDGISFHLHDERSCTFRSSSWVSRLHPRLLSRPPAEPPPPPTQPLRLAAQENLHTVNADPSAPLEVGTVSTDESRTRSSISNPKSSFAARRYLNLLEQRAAAGICPPRLLEPPRFGVGDGGYRSGNGFGPFQVRPRSPALPLVGQGCLGDPCNGGGRGLGNDSYSGGGGYFPLFRRMAHLGEALDEERGNLGSRVGKQTPAPGNNWNSSFNTRSAPVGHNQVKLSPFFHFRSPQPNSSYSIDRNKGTIHRPMGGTSTSIWNNQSQMRPSSSENWNSPLPISCFPPQGMASSNPFWRQRERNLSVDPWHSSASVHHVAGSRGTCYHDCADEPGSTSTSRDRTHAFHQNAAVNHLERTPVFLNEPKEPISRWNTGKFKRSANFDDSLPLKFRKLSNDD